MRYSGGPRASSKYCSDSVCGSNLECYGTCAVWDVGRDAVGKYLEYLCNYVSGRFGFLQAWAPAPAYIHTHISR